MPSHRRRATQRQPRPPARQAPLLPQQRQMRRPARHRTPPAGPRPMRRARLLRMQQAGQRHRRHRMRRAGRHLQRPRTRPARQLECRGKRGEQDPIPSDMRLKQDITALGQTHDGLRLYRYRYIGDDTFYVGVMAQEVTARVPAAVSLADDGFLAGRLRHAGSEFSDAARTGPSSIRSAQPTEEATFANSGVCNCPVSAARLWR